MSERNFEVDPFANEPPAHTAAPLDRNARREQYARCLVNNDPNYCCNHMPGDEPRAVVYQSGWVGKTVSLPEDAAERVRVRADALLALDSNDGSARREVRVTDEMVNAGGLAIDNFEMADGDPFGVLLFDSDYVGAAAMSDMIGQKNEICKSLARACLEAALRGVEAPGGRPFPVCIADGHCESSPAAASPLDRNALREALEKILQANDSFRASLPDGWEGDPLNDACIEARALLALDSNDGAGREIPAGWQLVPVDPTMEMFCAGDESIIKALYDHSGVLRDPTPAQGCYAAMLAAAPALNVSEAGRSPSDALSDALTADVPREEYVRLIDAIDYTLTVHGKIDADTPLHDRIRKVYRAPDSSS